MKRRIVLLLRHDCREQQLFVRFIVRITAKYERGSNMKKLLSVVLAFAMTFSLCSTTLAAEIGYDDVENEVVTITDIEVAKDAYDALTPEAKAIFDKVLANDMELLQFHKTYVDASSDIAFVPQHRASIMIATAEADPMSVLKTQLAIIGLPTSVVYTLQAMGAGMVASIADGPLLVGEILLAAATVSAAVAIAANWNEVSPKWNSVVNAFKKAFTASASNVILYLPTYRRIEEQLKNIFPNMDSDDWSRARKRTRSDRAIELVEFGMADVENAVKAYQERLNNFSRAQQNKLTLGYLSEIIDEKYEQVDIENIKQLTEQQISEILKRIENSILSDQQKDEIRRILSEIRDTLLPPSRVREKIICSF